MSASILNLAQNVGYPTLVLLILAESAGIPLPGETALITAAVLAGQHRLNIALVIILASTAAIVGDNLGYLVGRKGGRWLLQRPGPFARQRARVLETGEPFFKRHGPKAVFLGRWILGLRTWAAWLAGANRMPWRSFFVWNTLGGLSWATTMGLVAYYAGHSATGTIALFGIAGLIGAVAGPGLLIGRRRRQRAATRPNRRRAPAAHPSAGGAPPSHPDDTTGRGSEMYHPKCLHCDEARDLPRLPHPPQRPTIRFTSRPAVSGVRIGPGRIGLLAPQAAPAPARPTSSSPADRTSMRYIRALSASLAMPTAEEMFTIADDAEATSASRAATIPRYGPVRLTATASHCCRV